MISGNMKLKEMIKKKGLERGYQVSNEIYKCVNDWDDLLLTNTAFLNGELWQTFYYCGSFISKGMEDPDYAEMKDALIELHNYGIYTFNGHSSNCKIMSEEIFKNYKYMGWNTSLGEEINENNYSNVELRQRSYLNFYCNEEMSEYLIPKIKESGRLYYLIMKSDGRIEKNTEDGRVSFQQVVFKDFPKDRIDVGAIASFPTAKGHKSFDLYQLAPPNIQRLLDDKTFFYILAKDMGGEEVTNILLKILKDKFF